MSRGRFIFLVTWCTFMISKYHMLFGHPTLVVDCSFCLLKSHNSQPNVITSHLILIHTLSTSRRAYQKVASQTKFNTSNCHLKMMKGSFLWLAIDVDMTSKKKCYPIILGPLCYCFRLNSFQKIKIEYFLDLFSLVFLIFSYYQILPFYFFELRITFFFIFVISSYLLMLFIFVDDVFEKKIIFEVMWFIEHFKVRFRLKFQKYY